MDTKRILVVEPEIPSRIAAVGSLLRVGYQVSAVADGAEALQMVNSARGRGTPFDLMLVNAMTFNASALNIVGPEAAASAFPPFLLMAGAGDRPTETEPRNGRLVGTIVKPICDRDLIERMQAVFAAADDDAGTTVSPAVGVACEPSGQQGSSTTRPLIWIRKMPGATTACC